MSAIDLTDKQLKFLFLLVRKDNPDIPEKMIPDRIAGAELDARELPEVIASLQREKILMPADTNEYCLSDKILAIMRIFTNSTGAFLLSVSPGQGEEQMRTIAFLYKRIGKDEYLMISSDDLRKDRMRMEQTDEGSLKERLAVLLSGKAEIQLSFLPSNQGKEHILSLRPERRGYCILVSGKGCSYQWKILRDWMYYISGEETDDHC